MSSYVINMTECLLENLDDGYMDVFVQLLYNFFILCVCLKISILKSWGSGNYYYDYHYST